MSARRWFGGAALAALVAAAAAVPAQGQIVARVGGNLAGRIGDTVSVPVTVDLRGAPGVRLGSYRLALRYNSDVLSRMYVDPGSFAPPLVNDDSAWAGAAASLRLTAVQPSGADSVVTLFVVRFMVTSDTGSSPVTLEFDEMSAAGSFDDLLPSLSVVNGSFCHAAGRWGDVDGDGLANSRDALIALSKVVGLRLDTLQIIPIDSLHADTIVTMRPGLSDVDGDGAVTSRDALIIVSHAVGLPVSGFRIGLAAAGACGTGLGITLSAWPDTVELQTGQTANVVVSARDGAGQPVSLSGATWTSGNTAVAAAASGFGVEARDPGVAVFTVRLGASYSASMVVRVIAHRSQWFVDAARVHEPLQTGSAAFPFAYIQDAFDAGRDADTINVAAGRYEEAVGSDISVLLRGDSASPPVIDPRGAYYYSPYTAALNTGSRAAPMVIQDFSVDHGHIAISAHDLVVRRVHIAGDSLVAPLYFMGAPSLMSSDTGNLLLDHVTVDGYGDAVHAIEVPVADTVIIQYSSITRAAGGTSYCGPSLLAAGAISVQWAAHTEIRNNYIAGSPCMGIAVRQPTGSVVISSNTVTGLAGTAVAASAPVIALDHNLIRDARVPGYPDPAAHGVWITADEPVQTVSSLGDVIRNVGSAAIEVQAGTSVVVDSLVADSIGLDASFLAGVDVHDARLTVTNSYVADVTSGPGASVMANQLNNGARLESRHNVMERINGAALMTSELGARPMAPRVLAGPPVQRGPMGGSNYGPDTLLSVGDSIRASFGDGIYAEYGLHLLVDSTVIDGISGYGIWAYNMNRVTIRASAVRGAGFGAYLSPVDTAEVFGSALDSNATDGIFVDGGPLIVVDSSRFAGNGRAGIYTNCMYCSGVTNVTRSSLVNNNYGMIQDGYSGADAFHARGNNITGNVTGGAMNYSLAWGGPGMDADSNYWNDSRGPQCSGGASGCDSTSTGDFVLSAGISFANYLSAPATGVMAAPRILRPTVAVTARSAMAPSSSTSPAPATQAAPAPVAAAPRPTPALATPRPELPRTSWRKGGPPRPVTRHPPT